MLGPSQTLTETARWLLVWRGRRAPSGSPCGTRGMCPWNVLCGGGSDEDASGPATRGMLGRGWTMQGPLRSLRNVEPSAQNFRLVFLRRSADDGRGSARVAGGVCAVALGS